MSDVAKNPSLAQDYFLKGKETAIKVVEEAAAEEVPEKTEETPAVVESSETPAAAVEASSEASDAAVESTETAPAAEPAAEEDSGSAESATAGDEEATEETRPEIKLETAPADFRFPTTNQTRHCFTRYVEYHRCVAAKGDDAPECQKFAKYYRALCPGEWVDRWNEQRENGTFPGPL